MTPGSEEFPAEDREQLEMEGSKIGMVVQTEQGRKELSEEMTFEKNPG